MIDIVFKWNANYLVYTNTPDIQPVSLESERYTIVPGDRICKIGSKRRSEFELKTGCFMEYEGVLKQDKLQYAIFKCSEWDLVDGCHYRYAFNTVILNGKLKSFLQGGRIGMRDIDVETIIFHK